MERLPPLTTHEETVGRNHIDPSALKRYQEAMRRLHELRSSEEEDPLPGRNDDEGSRDDGRPLVFGPPADDEARKAMQEGIKACRRSLE